MAQLADDRRARLREWLASGEARLQPLTNPQRELWEAAPYPAADVSNHICAVAWIHGAVARDICDAALRRVVARQEVLRLSVLPGRDGPVQLIRARRAPVFSFRELAADAMDDAAIDAHIMAFAASPFDLVGGPLYRVEILRRSPFEHVLVLVIHHAIADGWTLGVFMKELWGAYAALLLGVPGGGTELPLTYSAWGAADRAYWKSAEGGRRAEFWMSALAGSGRVFGLAATPTSARGRLVTHLPADLVRALRDAAQRAGTTLFVVLLCAFHLVLAKASGRRDLVVGTPVAQRNKRALAETMGSCAGIVPLRARIDGDATFAGHLRATDALATEAFANAMPFADLVRAIGDPVVPGLNPVFDVRFALQNHPVPDISLPGIAIEYRTRSTGTARFDLACELTGDNGDLEVVWLFREDSFDIDAVRTLDDRYAAAVRAALARPDDRLATLIDSLP